MPVGRALRARALLGRVFLHGNHSQRYAIHIEGDGPAALTLAQQGTPLLEIPDLWQEIRGAVNGEGFAIPPLKPLRQRTSSHYAASFPIGRGPVGVDGSIAPGIYLCDSSIFPAPATSPTFTIMANARHICDLSLR